MNFESETKQLVLLNTVSLKPSSSLIMSLELPLYSRNLEMHGDISHTSGNLMYAPFDTCISTSNNTVL